MPVKFIRYCFFVSFLFVFGKGYAQIHQPVKWAFDTKELSENQFELQFKAKIEPGWHMYSQHLPNDEGPIATSFDFEKNKGFELLGKVTEPKAITEYDPNFEMNLSYFEEEVTFKQVVKLKSDNAVVKGGLEFMVCDASKCLPPEYVEFSFNLKKGNPDLNNNRNQGKTVPEEKINNKKTISPEKKTTVQTEPEPAINASQILDPVSWGFEARALENNGYELVFKAKIDENWHIYASQLSSEDGPVPTGFVFNTDNSYTLEGPVKDGENLITEYDPNFDMDLSFFENEAVFTQKIKLVSAQAEITGELTYMACDDSKCLPPDNVPFKFSLGSGNKEVVSVVEADNETLNRSLWTIFFIAFFSGFAALLTPCVFPMIPMTVSFFTKQSQNKAEGIKNAIFYGISIIVIYVILGTVVTAVFGSDALNALSTNVIFNIFFFLLLVIFAISFMGAFEITLPASWVNKADKASDKGGLIGIFFMAFTLALVSFSCTGPIVGTLLVEAANIGGSGPVVGMLGFSAALALPFALFAAFPGWMNTLPKSGGWLNTVKVFLGFLELALAFKFLSNADLVVQGHYLEREMFLAIWVGIFSVLAIYLFGFIRLPHDSPVEYISVGRALLGITTVIFVVYLIPGLWGAPLKLISGFPPPMSYSESPMGFGTGNSSTIKTKEHGPEGTHFGPQGIYVFHDLDEGLAYAKKVGKPAFLDFTGHACVNCRKMEENVWGEPGVIEILRNDVVVISLYVDDKRELPEPEKIEVEFAPGKTRTLKTVGNKWSYIQATRYLTNTQPYYRMLGPNGEDLDNGSADYEHHGNAADFKAWLKEGLKSYKEAEKKG